MFNGAASRRGQIDHGVHLVRPSPYDGPTRRSYFFVPHVITSYHCDVAALSARPIILSLNSQSDEVENYLLYVLHLNLKTVMACQKKYRLTIDTPGRLSHPFQCVRDNK